MATQPETVPAPSALERLKKRIEALDIPPDQKSAIFCELNDALREDSDQLWKAVETLKIVAADEHQKEITALRSDLGGKLAEMKENLQRREKQLRRISELNDSLKELIGRDEMTGLLSAKSFERVVKINLRLPRGRWLALGFIDGRKFGIYNKALGQAVGDKIIVRIAEILKASLRPSDLPARLGGDEYAFLLRNLENSRTAHEIASRFQDNIVVFPWASEHMALVGSPPVVDVGVVSVKLTEPVKLDSVDRIYSEMFDMSNKLMIQAKEDRVSHVYHLRLRLDGIRLCRMEENESDV